MHIYINVKEGENPAMINTNLDNFLIFQAIENVSNLFYVYERKKEKN